MEFILLGQVLGEEGILPTHLIEIGTLIGKEILRWAFDVAIFLAIVLVAVLWAEEIKGSERQREEVLEVVMNDIVDCEEVGEREERRKWFLERLRALDLSVEVLRDQEKGGREDEEEKPFLKV